MSWLRRRRDECQIDRQHDLAEMEDRNREMAEKVDQLTRLLDELKERKRGHNP